MSPNSTSPNFTSPRFLGRGIIQLLSPFWYCFKYEAYPGRQSRTDGYWSAHIPSPISMSPNSTSPNFTASLGWDNLTSFSSLLLLQIINSGCFFLHIYFFIEDRGPTCFYGFFYPKNTVIFINKKYLDDIKLFMPSSDIWTQLRGRLMVWGGRGMYEYTSLSF